MDTLAEAVEQMSIMTNQNEEGAEGGLMMFMNYVKLQAMIEMAMQHRLKK